ncbi:hypothetical protein B0H16DRAFT_219508 [Mycena metata]|uniref:BTB domain-containing protein n=1 Tax=Mycena metata TaxID=1033252 RepID=A0AAD7JUA7_9AGAR|nr:hypothetical protein B0H16DRAFT_219508 [Mycena metata]
MKPTSHCILWSDDEGCVVIKAEQRKFCVSRHLLAFHSPIFASMFELATGNEVELLEDGHEEVTVFLRALLDPRYSAPLDFEDALGILRLAHKYDVPFLVERAIIHLESIYPTTLAHAVHPTILADVVGEFNFWAVDVFKRIGAVWLLPSAYFSISVEPWSNYRERFSLEIQEMALRVQVFNMQNSIRLLEVITSESLCDCRVECDYHKQKAIHLFIQNGARDFNFLRQWDALSWQKLDEALCAQCFQTVQLRYQQRLDEMWKELPGVCTMGSWEDLTKKRVDYFRDLHECVKQRSEAEYTRVGI